MGIIIMRKDPGLTARTQDQQSKKDLKKQISHNQKSPSYISEQYFWSSFWERFLAEGFCEQSL